MNLVKIEVSNLTDCSDEDLASWIKKNLLLSREALLNAAAGVVEMRRRGKDLSWMDKGLLRNLCAIAERRALPEVVSDLDGRLRRKVMELAIVEQERLMREKQVRLLVMNGDNPEYLQVALDNLTPNQINQVFDRGSIRGDAAQRAWLEDWRAKASISQAKAIDEVVTIDRARHGLIIGGVFVSKNQILTALMDLK